MVRHGGPETQADGPLSLDKTERFHPSPCPSASRHTWMYWVVMLRRGALRIVQSRRGSDRKRATHFGMPWAVHTPVWSAVAPCWGRLLSWSAQSCTQVPLEPADNLHCTLMQPMPALRFPFTQCDLKLLRTVKPGTHNCAGSPVGVFLPNKLEKVGVTAAGSGSRGPAEAQQPSAHYLFERNLIKEVNTS